MIISILLGFAYALVIIQFQPRLPVWEPEPPETAVPLHPYEELV